jgi:hypothetical protein
VHGYGGNNHPRRSEGKAQHDHPTVDWNVRLCMAFSGGCDIGGSRQEKIVQRQAQEEMNG